MRSGATLGKHAKRACYHDIHRRNHQSLACISVWEISNVLYLYEFAGLSRKGALERPLFLGGYSKGGIKQKKGGLI